MIEIDVQNVISISNNSNNNVLMTITKKFYHSATTDNTYIDAVYSEDKLVIFTTPDFEFYEQRETSFRMTMVLNFECSVGTRRLTFFQDIKAVNNYEPEFSQEPSYEIVIPTPLPPGLDITFLMVQTSRLD